MIDIVNFKLNFQTLWNDLFKKYPFNINQIQKLCAKYPNFPIKQMLTQFSIYKKNQKKFINATNYLFTITGAQQSSSSSLAMYHQQKFLKYSKIADLCCGCGIDLNFLAKNKDKVYAIDLNQETIKFAKYNNKNYENIDYITKPAENFNIPVEAIFADPDRRKGLKRLINPEDMQPKLSQLIKLSKNVKAMAIKLSPMLDYTRLNLDIDYSLEFVSENNTLKELLLLTGEFARKSKHSTAVLLPKNIKICSDNTTKCCKISTLKEYIYEPDAAIIRAHLVKQFANKFAFDLLDENLALATSEKYINNDFSNCYKVITCFNYKLKNLNKYIKDNKLGILDIKTRGFSEPVEFFRKKLKNKGKKEAIIYIIKVKQKHLCLICERIN